ncbi:MAG: hypothetical protein ACP5Q4_09820, partial [Candidatus Caldatribacteriaceae bacterium]
GLVDQIPLERIKDWETQLYAYLEKEKPGLLGRLEKEGTWSHDLEGELKGVIAQFTADFLGGTEKKNGQTSANQKAN